MDRTQGAEGTKFAALGLVATIASICVACGAGGGEALDEPAWATRVCAIAQDVSGSLASLDDGVDPSALSLEERAKRAKRLQEPVAEILDDAAARMAEISPPDGAETYHNALASGWRESGAAYREAVAKASEATSVAEIEDGNTSLAIVLEQVRQDVVAAAESLSDDALAALRAVSNCQDLVG